MAVGMSLHSWSKQPEPRSRFNAFRAASGLVLPHDKEHFVHHRAKQPHLRNAEEWRAIDNHAVATSRAADVGDVASVRGLANGSSRQRGIGR